MLPRRRKRRHKFVNGIKGAISILLCLLLTPFMSITLGLVEYYRYQSVIEIADEILELTGLSTISDYDSYVHKRFGLLCLSQESNLNANAADYAETAAASLGKQIAFDNVEVKGELSLAETEVLKQQVIDFSELTVPTAVLLEDFNVEELLASLNVVEKISGIIEAVQTFADLTKALKTAAEKAEALEEKLQALQNSIAAAASTAQSLAQKVTDLCEKLATKGLFIPEEAEDEDILSIVTAVASDYADNIRDIASTARTLNTQLENIKSSAETALNAANEFVAAVEAASDVVVADGSTTADTSKSATDTTRNTLETVLDNLEGAARQVANNLEQETVDSIKNAVNEILDQSLESLGIAGMVDRYASIADGSYFELPLTPQAKSDLTALISLVPSAWEEGDASELLATLKSMFVPNITFNPSALGSIVENVVRQTLETLGDNALAQVVELLEKLINTLKKLFDLDIFYEADLNAFVNVSTDGEDNGYQDFLDAIGDMFTAVEKFGSAVTSGNLFKKLIGSLSAVWDLFKAVIKTFRAIVTITTSTLSNVGNILAEIASGDVSALYERLVVAGYMRHNLPCRLSSGDTLLAYDAEGHAAYSKISLNGTALTGYHYNDIARPNRLIGQDTGQGNTTFQSLASFLNRIKTGSGQDTMFAGAELEYIRAGTNSEIANQVIVFFDLYFLRLLLNVATVFMDHEVAGVAAAATVASWVVYLVYILAEPFLDVILLVNDGEVSFVKDKCYMTVGGIGDFVNMLWNLTADEALRNTVADIQDEASEFGGRSGQTDVNASESNLTKVDYESHVLLLLAIFVKENTMIERLGHLIDLEATEHYGKNNFSMDETYATICINADVYFKPLFDFGVSLDGSRKIDLGY